MMKVFKMQLISFLLQVPDQLVCDGYVSLWVTSTNSLVDQAISRETWPQVRLGKRRALKLVTCKTGNHIKDLAIFVLLPWQILSS